MRVMIIYVSFLGTNGRNLIIYIFDTWAIQTNKGLSITNVIFF